MKSSFENTVIQAAQFSDWRVAHFRAIQGMNGRWRTPVAAQGKGFPDLVMVRDNRLIFAEIKGEKNQPEPEQKLWLNALEQTCAEVYLWRPQHWGDVVKILELECV